MIVLGGATRLANSGLSITEWKPLSGFLPPLSHDAWLSEFEKYKRIPEFLGENPDMNLAGFKSIYKWEWAHRLLGRVIGIVFFVPLYYFGMNNRLPKAISPQLWLLMILILFQAILGWVMVSSGLIENRVDVTQQSLAAHLGVAFVILGLFFHCFMQVTASETNGSDVSEIKPPLGIKMHAWLIVLLVLVQVIAGALVAGTHAGLTYNTWPLMDGQFIPSGYTSVEPADLNVFENVTAIQFNHRVLAYLVVVLVISFYIRARKFEDLRKSAFFLLFVTCCQVVLGIMTLLLTVPMSLALMHQFLAITVFLAALDAAVLPKQNAETAKQSAE